MRRSKPKKLLSKHEEGRLIEAGQRVLLDGGYPNPDRVGCPGTKVLKALAERRMDLRDAKAWPLHISTCSPCFIEYTAFRKRAMRRKAVGLTFGGLTLLVVIGCGIWLWKSRGFVGTGRTPNAPTVATYQPLTLDLRNRIVLRGEQPSSAPAGPIQLPRERLDLTIFLPVGSESGRYEVQVSPKLGKTLITATGPALIQNGITALKVKLDVSRLNPGSYVLGIGQPGEATNFYPLLVK
jgi:hypothetical protein